MEHDTLQTPTKNNEWSWGAFMLDVPFLIAIKKYTLLLWYLLAFIPFVNFLFFIGFKIYIGTKGRALAAESDQFANEDERNGFMKAFDHAGKILFFSAIAIFGIMIILMLAGVTLTKYKLFNFPGSQVMR